MSADLLITALVVDEDHELDFEAADRAVVALEGIDVIELNMFDNDLDQAEGLKQIRAVLRSGLRVLREAIGSHLGIAELNVRGATLYITGGMSYGVGPTEVWVVMARLRAAPGVLAAVGFEEES